MNKINNPKILFFHSSSDLYGASKILVYVLEACRASGFIPIICLSDKGPLSEILIQKGFDVRIIKLAILRRKYFSFFGFLNRIYYFILALIKLTKIIKTEKVQIIYSNTTAVFVGFVLSAITKVAHIVHIHEIILSPKVFVRITSWLIKRYSNISIAVSTPVKNYWIEAGGIANGKINVIHNGLEPSDFSNISLNKIRNEINCTEDELLIGMIARVSPWKGQKYFLDLAKIVSDNHQNVRFLMVGDVFPGNEYLYNEIEGYKKQLGLLNVVDLGYRKDIPEILASLDILILPSILPDPLPTVVLEAMFSKKMVIATKHGGALEMVVHNETGYYIPWDDPKMSYDIIKESLINKDLRTKFGESGYLRANQLFEINRFKKDIINQLNFILPLTTS